MALASAWASLPHAVERAAAVGLGGPAPAGADRIDHDQIGEGEPGLRDCPAGARRPGSLPAKFERSAARPDPRCQKGRCRARPAVESEGDGTVRRLGILGDIGGVVDRGRALARLIEQRERSRGRGIGELAAGNVDAVLGDGVRRQQPQHAVARCSPCRCFARRCSVCCCGGRRGRSCALASVAAPAMRSAKSSRPADRKRLSVVMSGRFIGRPGSVDPAGAPRLEPHHSGSRPPRSNPFLGGQPAGDRGMSGRPGAQPGQENSTRETPQ